MFHRLAIFSITAFWLVMMGMLVRLETHPETTDILDVPASYVARIMFLHGQPSFLTLLQGDNRIGSISVRPSITASGERSLVFSGGLWLQLPLAAQPQRLNFDAAMDMDSALRVLDFHLGLAMQDPRFRLEANGDMSRKFMTCKLSQGDQPASLQMLPLDAARFGPALLQDMGLPANALPMIAPAGVAPPAVTARETQINIHGEQLEVYQVTIREGTAVTADFYVTQLGQIVLAKTNCGYSLSAEEYQ